MGMTIVSTEISMKLITSVYGVSVSKMNTMRSAVRFLMIMREWIMMTYLIIGMPPMSIPMMNTAVRSIIMRRMIMTTVVTVRV